MRCEWKGCKNRTKIKMSVHVGGWKATYCFKHGYKMLKPLLKNVHRWNQALYIQKVTEDDD